MPLAIGGSSGPAKPSHGTLWVDVRDYGARADNGVTDNSVPFQAAIDALGAKLTGSQGKGVVFIPSAPLPYVMTKSVFVDFDNVEIQGEGWGTWVAMSGYTKFSAFIFGIRRVQTANVNGTNVALKIDGSNRPDLFGKLDPSAVPSSGTNWGIRTNSNSFVQFHAGPISSGVSSAADKNYCDNWGETSKLTLEFCIEPPDGQQFPVNAPILGVGAFDGSDPSPFAVKNWFSPNLFLVYFRTSDMDARENAPVRFFGFSLAGASAPFRIVLQFDLDNAVCSAFVNGVQVALSSQSNMSPTSTVPFVPGSGLKFASNDHYPFMIGANGIRGPFGGPTGVDLRLYGLRLSNTLRYQNNGPGRTQVRADSPATPVNDAWAYFGRDANTICNLAATDNPATSGRVVTVQNGATAVVDGWTSGLFIHSTSLLGVTSNAIRDIFVSASTPYGQAITLGAVLEMTIENVKATHGFHGVGSFNMQANYYIYIDNCYLDGFDAPYYGFMQLFYGRNISFATAGRVTMRHMEGGGRWDNVLVGRPSPVSEYIFKARGGDYGGAYTLSQWVVDYEGSTVSRAAIYCEVHGQAPATSLVMSDIFLGTIGATSSIVQLRDKYPEGPGFNKCWFKADNIQAYTSSYLAAVDVDGPLWHGEVTGVALTGPRFVHRQVYGTRTGVVVHETKFVGPPRELPWYVGAHALHVRGPVDGQYAEWRCVGSGTYGTANPPVWVGLGILSASASGLAAYVLDKIYMTLALS